jgi:hypothetical protein
VLLLAVQETNLYFFGHTAIRISDPDNYIDAVFNYGAFDFNTLISFRSLQRRFRVLAVAHNYSDFINEYTYEKDLCMSKSYLFLIVRKNCLTTLQPHWPLATVIIRINLLKNCTSMVVDMINKTLGSTVITKRQM